MAATHYKIELLFDRRADGYFHVHSESLPGFHLAGMDLNALCEDIPAVISDLLWETKKIRAEDVVWVPTIEDIQRQFPGDRETYIVSVKAA